MKKKPSFRISFWGGHIAGFQHEDGNVSFSSQYPADQYIELMSRMKREFAFPDFHYNEDRGSWTFHASHAGAVRACLEEWAVGTRSTDFVPTWQRMDGDSHQLDELNDPSS